MSELRIPINGIDADYKEIESIPLSLSIKCDQFTTIGTVADSQVDNPARRLVLPGTVKNQTIEEQSRGEAQPSQIIVQGSPVFSGVSRLVQTERSGEQVSGYAFELFAGASVLFAELAGRNLRSLELGDIEYDLATVEASFDYTADTGGATFAPVYYGLLADSVDNGFTISEVRPHVFIKRIIDTIFSELRVTVESTLFETDFFKRLVNLFGVGNQWNANGVAAREFEASTGVTTTLPGNGSSAFIELPNEIIDTSNIWNLNVAVLSGGTWEFTINVPTIQNGNAFLEISGLPDIPLQQQLFAQNFGPISVASGATARIRVDPINTLNPSIVDPGFSFRGFRQADPGVGDTISLASCLHERKITEFLAGLSHAFNLAWHYDSVLRILTVDPRFDFKIQGTVYQGFYKRVNATPEDWNKRLDFSQATEQKGVRPFGNYLSLNFADEDSYFYRLARYKGTAGVAPFLGARFDFSETGNPGTTSENPYFENLILLRGASSTNLPYLPAILADDSNGEVDEPAYECNPKMAYFAGNIANYSPWKWNGTVMNTRPVLFQQPKPGNDAGIDVCISYSNYQTSAGLPGSIPGLVETFYFRWLNMMENALSVQINMNFETSDIRPSADLFRTLKRFYYPGGERLWVFIAADQFQPLKSSASPSSFFEFLIPFETDKSRLIQNTQTPTVSL